MLLFCFVSMGICLLASRMPPPTARTLFLQCCYFKTYETILPRTLRYVVYHWYSYNSLTTVTKKVQGGLNASFPWLTFAAPLTVCVKITTERCEANYRTMLPRTWSDKTDIKFVIKNSINGAQNCFVRLVVIVCIFVNDYKKIYICTPSRNDKRVNDCNRYLLTVGLPWMTYACLLWTPSGRVI